jgi:hypothetical protein
MRTLVTWYSFADAFKACGRESQFSRPALMVLFDHLEDLEDQSGTEIELDVVGLCCDFAEYDSALDAARAYGYQFTPGDPDSVPLEWLQERTTVLTVPHQYNVVIQNF